MKVSEVSAKILSKVSDTRLFLTSFGSLQVGSQSLSVSAKSPPKVKLGYFLRSQAFVFLRSQVWIPMVSRSPCRGS